MYPVDMETTYSDSTPLFCKFRGGKLSDSANSLWGTATPIEKGLGVLTSLNRLDFFSAELPLEHVTDLFLAGLKDPEAIKAPATTGSLSFPVPPPPDRLNDLACVLSRENTRKNRPKIPMSPRVFFPSAFAA